MCGWYNTKILPILQAFLLSHCPLPHLDQVIYNTLLTQSDLLSDPGPQTFIQTLVYHIWQVSTHKPLGHTEEKTLPTTFPACLSWKSCICPLYHSSSTMSYSFNSTPVVQQYMKFWFFLLVFQVVHICIYTLEEGLVPPCF